MALLDPNASDIDNIQRASFLYGRAETSVAIAEQLIARRTIEYGKHTDDEVKRAMRICDMIATIKFFEKVVKAFKSLIDSINEVFTWLADKIDYIVVPYLLKKYQIILLKIKQLVTTVKLKAAKAMQAVVNSCMTGVGSAIAAVLLAPLQALMLTFQGLAVIAGAVLQGVQAILSLIPGILCVAAEKICLFMTPKSLKKTEMNVVNINQSITDRLGAPLKKAVMEILQAVKKANVPVKVAAIAAGAAAGAMSIAQGKELTIPNSICKSLELVNPEKLSNMLNKLLAFILSADPLPKYENLSIKNPGFLLWLMTGFLPAGKLSFGIPGMP